MHRRAPWLALLIATGACAEGSGDSKQTEAVADSAPRFDGSDGSDTDASSEGSLFDALDDVCASGTVVPCTTGCGTPGDSTCVAGEFGKCVPKPGDPCSGLDCKGKGDGLEHVYFQDADGDGHGVPTKTIAACTAPAGYASGKDDCDDGNGEVYPGAPEKCDLVDNDCNGKCDEGGSCRIGVHRSAKSGEHFYTTSLSEAKCCGFTLEQENAFYLYSGSATGLTALYRCVVLSNGKHFYTTDPTCEGQKVEAPIGNLAKAAVCGGVALMRLWHPSDGDHLYTIDPAERTSAIAGGWKDEGTIGYVWVSP